MCISNYEKATVPHIGFGYKVVISGKNANQEEYKHYGLFDVGDWSAKGVIDVKYRKPYVTGTKASLNGFQRRYFKDLNKKDTYIINAGDYGKHIREKFNANNGFHIFLDINGAIQFFDYFKRFFIEDRLAVKDILEEKYTDVSFSLVEVMYKSPIVEGVYSDDNYGGYNQRCITAKYMKIVNVIKTCK